MTDITERDIHRGERALALLRDEILIEAFQIIEQDLIDKWQSSPARDVQARETLYLSQMLLQRLQNQLQLVLETGQVAKATLAQRIKQSLHL
jgi:hypothetical protein